jgi:predicted SnoaL-like aldol condensation-catalyzing enzyme
MRVFRFSLPLSLLIGGMLAALGTVPATAHDRDHDHNRDQEAANKALVRGVTGALLGPMDAQKLSRYFAPSLIQHEPTVADGRQGVVEWIGALRQEQPARTMVIKHMIADGDLVFVQAQLTATPADERTGLNRYDIYRLAGGSIVEHWAVSAKAPTHSVSGNSAFSDLYTYPTPPAAPSDAQVELNRLLVTSLSERVFAHQQFDIVDRFWDTGYLQHNPWVDNGRAALEDALPYISEAGAPYRVWLAMADGDLALTCSHNQDVGDDPADDYTGLAVCDLYRVADLALVEHWDVAQAVPSTSVSGHSMFSSLYRGHGR